MYIYMYFKNLIVGNILEGLNMSYMMELYERKKTPLLNVLHNMFFTNTPPERSSQTPLLNVLHNMFFTNTPPERSSQYVLHKR